MDVTRPLAWGVVLALHVLYFVVLTTLPVPQQLDQTPDKEMLLVLLPPAPEPIQTAQASAKGQTSESPPPSRATAAPRGAQSSPANRESQPLALSQLETTLDLRLPEPGFGGATFKQDLTSKNRHRTPTAPKAERFRMREPITPEDVVKGTAQFLGLWPPGYTTDPCPEIQKSIEGLMADTSATGRRQLDLELRLQRDYCH